MVRARNVWLWLLSALAGSGSLVVVSYLGDGDWQPRARFLGYGTAAVWFASAIVFAWWQKPKMPVRKGATIEFLSYQTDRKRYTRHLLLISVAIAVAAFYWLTRAIAVLR